MNVTTLRKDYDKLTPFEKAVMLTIEATGRQRESEYDALAGNNLWESYWILVWQKRFITVALWAMTRAMQADRAWMLLYTGLFSSFDEKALEALSISIGWRKALERLEAETGAPFMAASSVINDYFKCPETGSKYLDAILEKWQKKPVEFSMQYQTLSELWAGATKAVNTTDESHRWLYKASDNDQHRQEIESS